MPRSSLVLVAVLLAITSSAAAARTVRRVALESLASGFTSLVDLQVPNDGTDRFFVVEQAGTIKIIKSGSPLPQDFLDIHRKVTSSGEMGLLGLAFHPNYSSNGRFFLNYTRTVSGQLQTVIAEYKASSSPDLADSSSERILLTVDQPFDNHNGGQVAFGPDGFFYFGLGDGGSGGDPFGNGQSLHTLLGKMSRIDVDHMDAGLQYAIPPDNPFASSNTAAREIWAYGFRNPWRFSFDRGSGQLFCGDVGQDRFEEIDIVSQGGNFGWNVMEGRHCFNPVHHCDKKGKILPIAEYSHKQGEVVIGGYVYNGSAIASLKGLYLFADFANGKIWYLRRAQGKYIRKLLLLSGRNISSFGQDSSGELYVVDYSGEVLKIVSQ